MRDGRDRKDKDENLYKLCLKYTKNSSYKDKRKRTEQKEQQQRRQYINYLCKAYIS